MCKKAIEMEIVEIGFSDHMDFEPEDPGFGFFNYADYTSEIKSAQERFKDKLVVRKGVELDYQYVFEDNIRKWIKNKEFDFIIGSVHYVNHEPVNCTIPKHADLEKTYKSYFNEVRHSIESCLFNVVGHLDILRKHNQKGTHELKNCDYETGIKRILEEISEKKMYLEINTKLSSLREKNIDTLPSRETVKEFVKDGSRLISIGSDAHLPKELGCGVKETLSFLESLNGDKFRLPFG